MFISWRNYWLRDKWIRFILLSKFNLECQGAFVTILVLGPQDSRETAPPMQ